ncbi:MAG: ribbon-helix-helix domain-containing protein [Xanthobacteraceae bacterium]|jgi:predicted DNA-binding ribbon-helix-helix protein
MTAPKPRHSAAWQHALDAAGKSTRGLVSHNVRIGNRRTSFRLDPPTWAALRVIAAREAMTLHELCTVIAEAKPAALSLTVSVRCYAVGYFASTVGGRAGRGTVHS